tara:strand:- start:3713 stop:4567 length:855 start_codon:yes stop_codon:yes gene_type:complete
MKKFLLRLLTIQLLINTFFSASKVNAIIPFYYLPSKRSLEQESLSIGKNAYQLLFFGQIKESLNLAKLAISLNSKDEKLWAILAESQIANNQLEEALISINKGKAIDNSLSEFYFAESSIFLRQKKFNDAKKSLTIGLKIDPNNATAIFQLGNIFLSEKNYEEALNNFEKAATINPKLWPAINNKGLVYFELNKKSLAILEFKRAISIEENAETLLALAVSLEIEDLEKSILLAKQALIKNPRYVDFEYRSEQLWGEKLQQATEKLFKLQELKEDIENAKNNLI